MPDMFTLVLSLLTAASFCHADSTSIPQEPRKPLKPRSPGLSGVLEWVFPMAGHVYAGKPGRGILPNLCRVGGAVLVLAEIESAEYDDSLQLHYNETRLQAGRLLALGGTAWAIWSAVDTANDRNEAIRRAALVPVTGCAPDGTVTVGLCYSF